MELVVEKNLDRSSESISLTSKFPAQPTLAKAILFNRKVDQLVDCCAHSNSFRTSECSPGLGLVRASTSDEFIRENSFENRSSICHPFRAGVLNKNLLVAVQPLVLS